MSGARAEGDAMGFGVAALAAAIAVLTALAAAFDAVVLRAMPGDRSDRLVSIVQRVPVRRTWKEG
jgi:acid phosphatase family membrane protein YuiD